MAHPSFILDTTILIDLLYLHQKAIDWFLTMPASEAATTVISLMEVLQGASNKQEMASLGRFLSRFQHLHLNKQDTEWALLQFRTFWLTHRIGMNDCLIASVAVRFSIPVYTVNDRDFIPLPNVKTIRPY